MEADKPLITAGNRGFRYGDGLFETMRLADGQLTLADYHFERFFEGMNLMAFDIPARFTASFFLEQILALCKKNGHEHTARVRLMVFRGSGGLFDTTDNIPEYIIETFPLQENGELNENGLVLGLYKDACKAISKFSGIKSNNYLPYAMAARYAKQQRWNDCLLLNSNGAICESTIANIFIIKNAVISTPGLQEGCVAGVMRRFILDTLPGLGYTVQEQTVTLQMIQEADEVFLTNAVKGIRWVNSFNDITYINKEISRIYSAINND
jgi:branched-chain amino acid aminotransferase